jgi:alcohol dehydrogenase (cytochrome c)
VKLTHALSIASLVVSSAMSFGQGGGVAPEELLKPLGKEWPTYNGDYTGK